MMIIYSVCIGVLGILLFIIYMSKYKGLPIDVWKPPVAWFRAIIYFCLCNFIMAASGTLEQVLSQQVNEYYRLFDFSKYEKKAKKIMEIRENKADEKIVEIY